MADGKKEVARLKKSSTGPKTHQGKLNVSRNATKHGIFSFRPVVAHFESEHAWQRHRQAILESLAPEGGMEEVLAERVALCSWRLNRVLAYETETITQEQEAVSEELEEDRRHKLRLTTLYKREAKEILAGTMVEGTVDLDRGEALSDFAVDMLAPLEVPLQRAINTRRYFDAVVRVLDGEPHTPVDYHDAGWLFEKACFLATELPYLMQQDDEEADEDEIRKSALELMDKLERRMEVQDTLTVSEIKEHLAWIAEAASSEHIGEDVSQVGYSLAEALLEKLHTVASHEAKVAEEQAQKVHQQIIKRRRAKILPSADNLQKIGRYESHLSKEMYRALHELEALQERRRGGKSPLARLDVQLP
jgi:hypothetical protein